jgi:hypothetical protein
LLAENETLNGAAPDVGVAENVTAGWTVDVGLPAVPGPVVPLVLPLLPLVPTVIVAVLITDPPASVSVAV